MNQRNYSGDKAERIDNRARCGRCFVDEAKSYGTLLMSKTISVYHRDGENPPVAQITVCPRCGSQYEVFVLPAGYKAGVTQANIRAIVSKSGCSSFQLEEIKGPERVALADATGGTRQSEPEQSLF